jgi:hypothetical protein
MPRYPAGQPIRLSTAVRDASGTPVTPGGISLIVRRPDLTPATFPTPATDGVGLYHQDLSTTDLAQLGTYRYEWVTTGTGAGVSPPPQTFDVYDPLAASVWPARSQVAKYVPERTVPADQSSDQPGADFGPLTTPTPAQADDHIAAAVDWVASATGTIAAALYSAAAEVAAVRAAGMIELAYPVRDADINTAQALLGQADRWLAALVEANEDVNVTDPGGGPGHVLPVWSFPTPVAWGDTLVWG